MMLYEWLCDNGFILEDGGVYMVIEFLYITCNPLTVNVYIMMLLHNVWREKHFCFQALDHDTFVIASGVPMLQAIIYDGDSDYGKT